jgi:hypothetical protein
VLVQILKPELPDWPGARLFCSTRQGGVSEHPYASLNLGDHVGDETDSVSSNRQRLEATWGAKPVFLQQVHGTEVVHLTFAQSAQKLQADACFTHEKNLACTIMVADCLPVLFYLPQAKLVAAAHAGCFNMRLASILALEKIIPTELETACRISMDNGSIVQSHLMLKARVGDIDAAQFGVFVEQAKETCPMSRLLRADISVEFLLHS